MPAAGPCRLAHNTRGAPETTRQSAALSLPAIPTTAAMLLRQLFGKHYWQQKAAGLGSRLAHRPCPAPHLQGMVDGAASLYDDCEGDLLRFQVLNGSLWVQHITERWAGSGRG